MKPVMILISMLLSCSIAYSQTNEENPIATVSQNPGLCSIFHRWGFIGDSLCSGEMEIFPDGSRQCHDMYEYSWGQRMCALMGVTGENYSQGGETAKGWIQHFYNDNFVTNHHPHARQDPKQAYIIALGCNDRNGKDDYPLGNVNTDVDINDYHNNAPSTFAGCYAGIIQRIQTEVQPQAKIFVVTMPRDGNPKSESYNEVIRSMSTLFKNVYVIDLYKYAPSYEKGGAFREQFFMYGHLNAAGYEYTAWMFMTYIDWIIRNNPRDFDMVPFIGFLNKTDWRSE